VPSIPAKGFCLKMVTFRDTRMKVAPRRKLVMAAA
jgi:hypothetical protein